MSRITIKDLRATVAEFNRYQMESGSTYTYREQGRNFYQAVDLYRIEPDGSLSNASMLEGGTSRECIDAIRLHHASYGGYLFPQKKTEITRAQALTAIKVAGLDLSADFFTLGSFDVELLITWAKLSRYQKPKAANGSRARYFWANLQRLDRKD